METCDVINKETESTSKSTSGEGRGRGRDSRGGGRGEYEVEEDGRRGGGRGYRYLQVNPHPTTKRRWYALLLPPPHSLNLVPYTTSTVDSGVIKIDRRPGNMPYDR